MKDSVSISDLACTSPSILSNALASAYARVSARIATSATVSTLHNMSQCLSSSASGKVSTIVLSGGLASTLIYVSPSVCVLAFSCVKDWLTTCAMACRSPSLSRSVSAPSSLSVSSSLSTGVSSAQCVAKCLILRE